MTAPLLPSTSAPLHPGASAPPLPGTSAPRHILETGGAGFIVREREALRKREIESTLGNRHMQQYSKPKQAVVLAILAVLICSWMATVQAQPGTGSWSEPMNLSQTPETSRYPVAIADREGNLHVFWVDDLQDVIYHRRLSGTSWSYPADILTSPDGTRPRIPMAAVDADDNLHLTWAGGDTLAELYYSRAAAGDAGSARAWSAPVSLAHGMRGAADVLVDRDGVLHVTYAEDAAAGNLYHLYSQDGGSNWSSPVRVSNVVRDSEAAGGGRLAVDGRNRLHVAWGEGPWGLPGPPLRVLYARSSDGGRTWSEPLEVDSRDKYEYDPIFGPQWISVASAGEDNVYLTWHGAGAAHRVFLWSSDGGQTWSDTIHIFPGVPGAIGGWNDMAVDSAGVVHIISSRSDGIVYRAWDGQEWTEPESFDNRKNDFHYQRLAISGGNRLHAVYADPSRTGEIWYATRLTSAPALLPGPMPTARSAVAATTVPSEVDGGDWSAAIEISEHSCPRARGCARYPVIASDSNGGLHAVWGEELSEDNPAQASDTILYAHWDGTSWSSPIAILVSPRGNLALRPAIAADNGGSLHVVWLGDSELYHSRAPISDAGSFQSWTPPVVVVESDRSIWTADVTADQRGTLHVAYARWGAERDVYYTHSSDGGYTWMEPINVSYIPRQDLNVARVRLVVDGQDRIHVVWDEIEGAGYKSLAVRYAWSSDGGRSWPTPFEVAVASESDFHVGWPSLSAVEGGEIHLVWNQGEYPYRYHRWSSDGGQTWSDSGRILYGLQGSTGFPELVVDSAGIIHLVTAVAEPGRLDSWAIYHSFWDGGEWSDPEFVGGGDYSENPRAAMSEGNRLNVVWNDLDTGRVLYATKIVPAPRLAPQPIPTSALPPAAESAQPTAPALRPSSTAPPPATVMATASATSRSEQADPLIDSPPVKTPIPWYPLVVAVVPVVIIVLVVVAFRISRVRNRWS